MPTVWCCRPKNNFATRKNPGGSKVFLAVCKGPTWILIGVCWVSGLTGLMAALNESVYLPWPLAFRQSNGHGVSCFLQGTFQFWRGRTRWAMGQCRVGPCLSPRFLSRTFHSLNFSFILHSHKSLLWLTPPNCLSLQALQLWYAAYFPHTFLQLRSLLTDPSRRNLQETFDKIAKLISGGHQFKSKHSLILIYFSYYIV